ncbi:hypothetical protein C3941_15615 [Kaistia algarum]|nr:hypothetical protein C3941_15615 [Kaistia algarum]
MSQRSPGTIGWPNRDALHFALEASAWLLRIAGAVRARRQRSMDVLEVSEKPGVAAGLSA